MSVIKTVTFYWYEEIIFIQINGKNEQNCFHHLFIKTKQAYTIYIVKQKLIICHFCIRIIAREFFWNNGEILTWQSLWGQINNVDLFRVWYTYIISYAIGNAYWQKFTLIYKYMVCKTYFENLEKIITDRHLILTLVLFLNVLLLKWCLWFLRCSCKHANLDVQNYPCEKSVGICICYADQYSLLKCFINIRMAIIISFYWNLGTTYVHTK